MKINRCINHEVMKVFWAWTAERELRDDWETAEDWVKIEWRIYKSHTQTQSRQTDRAFFWASVRAKNV